MKQMEVPRWLGQQSISMYAPSTFTDSLPNPKGRHEPMDELLSTMNRESISLKLFALPKHLNTEVKRGGFRQTCHTATPMLQDDMLRGVGSWSSDTITATHKVSLRCQKVTSADYPD